MNTLSSEIIYSTDIAQTESLPAEVYAQWDAEEDARIEAKKAYQKKLAAFSSLSERDNPARFVRVPVGIASGSVRLTAAQIMVYLSLRYCADIKSQVATYTEENLASAAGVSTRTVQRVLVLLEEKGLIKATDNKVLMITEGAQVRLSVEALWTSKPSLVAEGGKPLLSRGNALRSLLGLALAVEWDTHTVVRSHQSLAAQCGMSISKFRDGLWALRDMGLVIIHPEENYLVVRHDDKKDDIRREITPIRIKWSAASCWQEEIVITESKAAEAPQTKVAPVVHKPLSGAERRRRRYLQQQRQMQNQARWSLSHS